MALGLIGAIIPIDVSATNGGDAPVKIIIHNDFKDPNKKMTYVKHTNNKDVEIKTDTPKEIKAGEKGSFDTKFLNVDSESEELKLEYKIGKEPTVSFGYQWTKCFVGSKPGIHASYECPPSNTLNFHFKEG